MPLPILWAAAAPAHAQAPAFLVRDINTVPEIVGSDPQLLVQVGTTTFFVSSTPQTHFPHSPGGISPPSQAASAARSALPALA